MKSVVVESACTRASSSKAIVRPRGSRATAREHLSLDRLSLAEHVHLVSPYTFLRLFSYAGILAAVRGCASYLRPAPPPLQRPNYRIGEPATTMLSRRTFQGARRLERWHDGWWKVVYVWSTRACSCALWAGLEAGCLPSTARTILSGEFSSREDSSIVELSNSRLEVRFSICSFDKDLTTSSAVK